MARDRDAIAWSIAPTDTDIGRVAVYALVGAVGGFATLLVALVAITVGVVLDTADPLANAVLLGVAFLAGATLGHYLPRLARTPSRLPSLPGPLGRIDRDALDPLALAVSVTAGALALGVLFAQRPLFAFVTAGVAVPGGVLAVYLLAPAGQIDPRTDTLTVYDETYDLDALTELTAHPLGDLLLVRPQFQRTPEDHDPPSFFTMPRDAYARAEPAFRRGLAGTVTTLDNTRPGERITLATFALAALTLAAAIAFFASQGPTASAELLYWVATIPLAAGGYLLYRASQRTR